MDVSTLRCQGPGPKASPACSCCSAGSPGREAPFRLRLSSEMRNMLRRKWCLLAVALGTNGTGWKGENGLLCLAGPGLQGVPSWGERPCVVGGPLPGWPSSPGPQGTLCGWVAGEPPEGTGTVGMGQLVGTPLSSKGNPHTGHV